MKNYYTTVLIVEDLPDDQHFIERALLASGVTGAIRIVGDGQEAIDYLSGKDHFGDRQQFPYPTFILTDLKMPRADGFAVLEHIKNNPARAIIPTVVLSSSSDLDDIKKSYILGASSYHVKPSGYSELCHLIQVLHDYWMTCEVPQVDASGKMVPTDSKGKLGERIPQPT